MGEIFLYVFLCFCVIYTLYKLLEFFGKKIFGGRTAHEKMEEKYLRRRHMEESISPIAGGPIL